MKFQFFHMFPCVLTTAHTAHKSWGSDLWGFYVGLGLEHKSGSGCSSHPQRCSIGSTQRSGPTAELSPTQGLGRKGWGSGAV